MTDPKKLRVEEELPLKQGLKLTSYNIILQCIWVEEELPLKQGLKHELAEIVLPLVITLKRNFH